MRILPFLILISLTFSATAQTLYQQNFSGGIPAAWQNNDNTGGGSWSYSTTTSTFGAFIKSTTRSNGYVLFDSDGFGNDAMAEEADLITQPINCSTAPRVVVRFTHYFRQATSSIGRVSVSTDGVSWTNYSAITNTSDNPEVVELDISATAANQATVFIRFRYEGDWDYYWMIDDISVYVPQETDLAVSEILTPKYVPLRTHTIKYTLNNEGVVPVTSAIISASHNSATFYDTLTGLNIQPFESINLNFSTKVWVPEPEAYPVVITVNEVNGGSDDNSANNSLSKNIYGLSSIPNKNILLEAFVDANCGWCPGSYVAYSSIKAAHTNALVAAIHIGDIMEVTDGRTLYDTLIGYHTSGMVNRRLTEGRLDVVLDTFEWQQAFNAANSILSPASISAESNYSSGSRELTVEVEATFFTQASGDFRLNCFILEDGVTGGMFYNQANNYSGNTDFPWHLFFPLANPVVGFVHDDVLRAKLNGTWGANGAIPFSTNNEASYSETFSITLPAGWDDNNVKLIAVLQEYGAETTEREIINALALGLDDSKSTGETTVIYTDIEEQDVQLDILTYPNPVSDILYINGLFEIEQAEVKLFDISGREIYTAKPQVVDSHKVDVSELPQGMYLLQVKSDGKVLKTEKIIVN